MAASIKAIPSGYHSVTPTLTLRDSKRAIEFYQKALGAEVISILASPDGKSTMHAAIQIGDSIIMMGDEIPNSSCTSSAETLGSSPVGLYLYVADADALFNRAVAAGAKVDMPIADMFWGDRCGGIRDPFGYRWMIATHKRDLTQDEIRQGSDKFCAEMAKKMGKQQ